VVSGSYLETQADGLRHAGRTDEALAAIAEAQERARTLDDHHVEAELLRLKGVCLLAQLPDDHRRAAAYFRQALAVARRQRARLPELRAAEALAQLDRDGAD
jgi:tetratricopeptide (TPR) repeat protein